MATRVPIFQNGGVLTEIAAGDTIAPSRLGTGTPSGSKFLRDDGVFAVPAGGAAGSNVGTATIDFGTAPGTTDAAVVVTGQAAIAETSRLRAWLRGQATPDHSVDEIWVEPIRILAGSIVAGTGFTIYGVCDVGTSTGTYYVDWEWV